jgi:hypothetical protein
MEGAVSIYRGLQDRRLSVGDRLPPDEPRVDDDVQWAEQPAVEMDRATPCPQDFSEKVWLTLCGERSFRPAASVGFKEVLKDVARIETAHTSVNNALGVFSQQDRAKQVEEEATVVLLTASNYKVSASVGSGDQMTSTACCVLDTGSGLNLIQKCCVPAGVQQQTIPKGLPTIVAANKSRVPVDGMVRMVVKIGDVAQVETMLVTEHLPVYLILRTSWIDQHVEAIWPQRQVVTLVTGTCVAIECRDSTKKPIRLAEPVVVPPMAEASIRVRCDWRGLALVESRQSGRRAHLANGLAEFADGDIWLRFANFSENEVAMCTRQSVGYASRPLSTVAIIGDAGPEKPDVDDWWKQVDVDHFSTEERAQLRSVLTKHASMWDVTLGSIRGVFHRIDTGDHMPVHLQPRRAGPAARETEQAEVRSLLDAGVIEESEAEWSVPVVLVAKHDGSTSSAWTIAGSAL